MLTLYLKDFGKICDIDISTEESQNNSFNVSFQNSIYFIIYSLTRKHFIVGMGPKNELLFACRKLGRIVTGDFSQLVNLSNDAELVSEYLQVLIHSFEIIKKSSDNYLEILEDLWLQPSKPAAADNEPAPKKMKREKISFADKLNVEYINNLFRFQYSAPSADDRDSKIVFEAPIYTANNFKSFISPFVKDIKKIASSFSAVSLQEVHIVTFNEFEYFGQYSDPKKISISQGEFISISNPQQVIFHAKIKLSKKMLSVFSGQAGAQSGGDKLVVGQSSDSKATLPTMGCDILITPDRHDKLLQIALKYSNQVVNLFSVKDPWSSGKMVYLHSEVNPMFHFPSGFTNIIKGRNNSTDYSLPLSSEIDFDNITHIFDCFGHFKEDFFLKKNWEYKDAEQIFTNLYMRKVPLNMETLNMVEKDVPDFNFALQSYKFESFWKMKQTNDTAIEKQLSDAKAVLKSSIQDHKDFDAIKKSKDKNSPEVQALIENMYNSEAIKKNFIIWYSRLVGKQYWQRHSAIFSSLSKAKVGEDEFNVQALIVTNIKTIGTRVKFVVSNIVPYAIIAEKSDCDKAMEFYENK